jgi:AcrR family transcriptional regulator
MPRQSLRERQRLAIREELQQIALEMFAQRGYEDVAIAEIADAAGVSHRTFYRHYPTKEDVVLAILDEYGPDVRAHLTQHVGDDEPWKVLCSAFVNALQNRKPVEPAIMRMIFQTPRLQAAYFERQREWERMAADVIAERLGVDAARDPRPQLWSMIAFDIGYRIGYELAEFRSAPEDLSATFEQRYREAEQFFTGQLP